MIHSKLSQKWSSIANIIRAIVVSDEVVVEVLGVVIVLVDVSLSGLLLEVVEIAVEIGVVLVVVISVEIIVENEDLLLLVVIVVETEVEVLEVWAAGVILNEVGVGLNLGLVVR